MESLLGHLAGRFAPHPENVATESLEFILHRSAPAREAIAGFLQSLGAPVLPKLDFRTQVGSEDEGTPDLVGHDAVGNERLIVEAKFWAGLTRHQPVSYVKRLPSDSVLAFVVPSVRVDLLWRELLRRLKDDAILFSDCSPSGGSSRVAKLDGTGRWLLLFDWAALLSFLHDALHRTGDTARVEDVRQLQGLSARMNSTGFLPLGSAELTSGVWRRVYELANMVTEIVSQLEARKVASSDSSRLSSGPAWTQYKLKMSGLSVVLYFDVQACAHFFPTPFWLQVPSAVRGHLTLLALESPPRLIDHPEGYPYIALHVPLEVEGPQVIEAVVKQCADIASRLAAFTPQATALASASPAQAAPPPSPGNVAPPASPPSVASGPVSASPAPSPSGTSSGSS